MPSHSQSSSSIGRANYGVQDIQPPYYAQPDMHPFPEYRQMLPGLQYHNERPAPRYEMVFSSDTAAGRMRNPMDMRFDGPSTDVAHSLQMSQRDDMSRKWSLGYQYGPG